MITVARAALPATGISLVLVIALAAGAAAQVATLVSPDQTPEPETMETTVAFGDPGEALLAYAQCLRDNGIDVDDPEAGATGGRAIFGGGPGSDGPAFDRRSDEFIAANEACGDFLEAARPELDPAAEQERLEQQLALAQCIRDNGYEQYPDPAVDASGRLQRVGRGSFEDLGIDPRSAEFQAVITSCRDEAGIEEGRGFGGGFGGGRGGD